MIHIICPHWHNTFSLNPSSCKTKTLQWHHNDRFGISNDQPHDCLLSCIFRHRSKKTSKPRVTSLCEGNSQVTGEFPAQRPVMWKMFPFDDLIMAYLFYHYIDVIMTTVASQITSLTVVYSILYSGADQRKHQSSASLAFVQGIHRDRWIPRTKGQ